MARGLSILCVTCFYIHHLLFINLFVFCFYFSFINCLSLGFYSNFIIIFLPLVLFETFSMRRYTSAAHFVGVIVSTLHCFYFCPWQYVTLFAKSGLWLGLLISCSCTLNVVTLTLSTCDLVYFYVLPIISLTSLISCRVKRMTMTFVGDI